MWIFQQQIFPPQEAKAQENRAVAASTRVATSRKWILITQGRNEKGEQETVYTFDQTSPQWKNISQGGPYAASATMLAIAGDGFWKKIGKGISYFTTSKKSYDRKLVAQRLDQLADSKAYRTALDGISYDEILRESYQRAAYSEAMKDLKPEGTTETILRLNAKQRLGNVSPGEIANKSNELLQQYLKDLARYTAKATGEPYENVLAALNREFYRSEKVPGTIIKGGLQIKDIATCVAQAVNDSDKEWEAIVKKRCYSGIMKGLAPLCQDDGKGNLSLRKGVSTESVANAIDKAYSDAMKTKPGSIVKNVTEWLVRSNNSSAGSVRVVPNEKPEGLFPSEIERKAKIVCDPIFERATTGSNLRAPIQILDEELKKESNKLAVWEQLTDNSKAKVSDILAKFVVDNIPERELLKLGVAPNEIDLFQQRIANALSKIENLDDLKFRGKTFYSLLLTDPKKAILAIFAIGLVAAIGYVAINAGGEWIKDNVVRPVLSRVGLMRSEAQIKADKQNAMELNDFIIKHTKIPPTSPIRAEIKTLVDGEAEDLTDRFSPPRAVDENSAKDIEIMRPHAIRVLSDLANNTTYDLSTIFKSKYSAANFLLGSHAGELSNPGNPGQDDVLNLLFTYYPKLEADKVRKLLDRLGWGSLQGMTSQKTDASRIKLGDNGAYVQGMMPTESGIPLFNVRKVIMSRDQTQNDLLIVNFDAVVPPNGQTVAVHFSRDASDFGEKGTPQFILSGGETGTKGLPSVGHGHFLDTPIFKDLKKGTPVKIQMIVNTLSQTYTVRATAKVGDTEITRSTEPTKFSKSVKGFELSVYNGYWRGEAVAAQKQWGGG